MFSVFRASFLLSICPLKLHPKNEASSNVPDVPSLRSVPVVQTVRCANYDASNLVASSRILGKNFPFDLWIPSTFSTKANCQLQLLPTTVRLASTTHLEERSLPSLPIGDELAESPLVSKSRITQIVPVSQNTLRWSAHSRFRLPPDCSLAKRTGTTVGFSSSRKEIDNSAGPAI